MKKITAIVSSLILSASLLVGCGASSAPAPTTAPAATPAATVAAETAAETTEVKSYSVAIVQQLSHSSLDEIHEAISAELKARAEAAGMELTISDYNGQNDTTMLGQIGAQALDDKVDMIIPIATLAWSPPPRTPVLPSSTPPAPTPKPQASPVWITSPVPPMP